MPRAANAYRKTGPAIAPPDDDDDDTGAAARQKVTRIDATAAPRPVTSAPASIFAAAQAAKPKRAYSKNARPPLDQACVEVKLGVPIPPPRTKIGESPYAQLFERMPVGGMVELEEVRSNGFMAWGNKRAPGHLVRRILRPGVAGVWRVAPPGAVGSRHA